jgi:hypothetical protein
MPNGMYAGTDFTTSQSNASTVDYLDSYRAREMPEYPCVFLGAADNESADFFGMVRSASELQIMESTKGILSRDLSFSRGATKYM